MPVISNLETTAHSVAADMQDVPEEVVEAIRSDRTIPDGKLEALRRVATALVEQGGWLSGAEQEAFFAAGYSPAQLFGRSGGRGSEDAQQLHQPYRRNPARRADERPGLVPGGGVARGVGPSAPTYNSVVE